MRKRYTHLPLWALLLAWAFCSCTKVFPDDGLDYLWRLDRVEYKSGQDYYGNTCVKEYKTDVWYGFARNVVEVRHSAIHGPIGVFTNTGDSLCLDFSIYPDSIFRTDSLISILNECGMKRLTNKYLIEKIDREDMILSDREVRLSFTRW